MFTGLIQEMGAITVLKEHASAMELSFTAGKLASHIGLGDSISVNGVCLTATKIVRDEISVDVMKQTLLLTNLENLSVGDLVNLELAVLPTQRLGGHLVQGHVDGVGHIMIREAGERWERFVIAIPEGILKYVVPQGSITVNGVSLTIGSINDSSCELELWLIPETLSKTIFGLAKVGDRVNIEVDVLGKYVERLMAKGNQS